MCLTSKMCSVGGSPEPGLGTTELGHLFCEGISYWNKLDEPGHLVGELGDCLNTLMGYLKCMFCGQSSLGLLCLSDLS